MERLYLTGTMTTTESQGVERWGLQETGKWQLHEIQVRLQDQLVYHDLTGWGNLPEFSVSCGS